ncbi:YqhA family protein [Marinivivus vitaminiproducens]|uniref:YqhA family protein n=1 Tax=Marinivivus vitaminiproducens TaxID=3035935 RepID=UPI0027A4F7F9|nr:YqhA family protein [Geminicoccaceae bacterium SCSIO 64248]
MTDSRSTPAASRSTSVPDPRGSGRWLMACARLSMLIGIVSLMVAALALLVFGAVETYRHIVMIIAPSGAGLTNREVFLASIKLVDLVLLATILQVVAIGLYALFIDREVPVPKWLRTSNVDDLKSKLAGIVAVMLGVLFLEAVIEGGEGEAILYLGLAIAAVVAALSYFIVSHVEGGD